MASQFFGDIVALLTLLATVALLCLAALTVFVAGVTLLVNTAGFVAAFWLIRVTRDEAREARRPRVYEQWTDPNGQPLEEPAFVNHGGAGRFIWVGRNGARIMATAGVLAAQTSEARSGFPITNLVNRPGLSAEKPTWALIVRGNDDTWWSMRDTRKGAQLRSAEDYLIVFAKEAQLEDFTATLLDLITDRSPLRAIPHV
jgi:hypothetical protein